MIWHILAIIGTVLLCIAAFIVFIVLLVLFVPFKYSIRASYTEGGAQAKAKVKWLFGLAAAAVSYSDALEYKVRVLFIPVLKGSIGAEEKELTKKQIKKLEKKQIKKARRAKKKEDKKNKKAEDKEALKAQKKAASKDKSLKEKLIAPTEKIKEIFEKLKTVKYIWDAPVTKRALSFAKEILFKLLGHIRPKKIKGHVKFGTGDPAASAQLYAAASVLTAPYSDELVLEPDFDSAGFEAENIYISGRIFAGYMLLLVLRALRNKDIRRVIKYTRRNL